MANQVYANGREIACKAASGKSIAAFPDTCLSPPSPPAGPMPVPYPNTAYASDTTSGSTSVMISRQEVMLKEQSTFKKSTGDEAATKSLGMGVVTHTIQGEASFIAWSMDVKIEGQNVARHLDQMMHNEQCVPANTTYWPYLDAAAIADPNNPCIDNMVDEYNKCKDHPDPCKELGDYKPFQNKWNSYGMALSIISGANECLNARRCLLQPYDSEKTGCCYPQTPHHLIEAASVADERNGVLLAGITNYREKAAPCVCAEGTNQYVGTHGLMHAFQSAAVAGMPTGRLPLSSGPQSYTKIGPVTTYGDAKANSLAAFKKTFPESKCDVKCLAKQLDAYHNQCNINDSTPIRGIDVSDPGLTEADAGKMALDRAFEIFRLSR